MGPDPGVLCSRDTSRYVIVQPICFLSNSGTIIGRIAVFSPWRPGGPMSRIVRCSLIQATNAAAPDASLEATKQAMIDKHLGYIAQAAEAGAQIVCLQEIFFGPYF